jgi:hypothetical protein
MRCPLFVLVNDFGAEELLEPLPPLDEPELACFGIGLERGTGATFGATTAF